MSRKNKTEKGGREEEKREQQSENERRQRRRSSRLELKCCWWWLATPKTGCPSSPLGAASPAWECVFCLQSANREMICHVSATLLRLAFGLMCCTSHCICSSVLSCATCVGKWSVSLLSGAVAIVIVVIKLEDDHMILYYYKDVTIYGRVCPERSHNLNTLTWVKI